jgi:hypothetical protein
MRYAGPPNPLHISTANFVARQNLFQVVEVNSKDFQAWCLFFRFNPDSAVEREVMSKEQTLRSEDNAFLPLRRRQLSVRCITALSRWRRRAKRQKNFETEHSSIFASPGLPLAHFLTAESGFK